MKHEAINGSKPACKIVPQVVAQPLFVKAGWRIAIAVLLFATVVAKSFQLPASAQEQRSEVVQKLYDLTQDFSGNKILPVRGGTKDKPLGCYIGNVRAIEGIFCILAASITA